MRAMIVSIALVISTPLIANSGTTSKGSATTTQGAPQVHVGEKAKPKKICKEIEGTGSRLDRQKLCLTKEEWERYDRGY